MVRSSLHNLSSCGTIVLFTPVITPAVPGKSASRSTDNIDPFEALGRALSRYHKRIRHVPFVPKVGFTETHDAFVSQADVVIVVICEPSTNKQDGLGEQAAFAGAAQDCMESNDIGRRADDNVMLIQCGNLNGESWPDMSQFDGVLKCRVYNVAAAQEIARKLFEFRK